MPYSTGNGFVVTFNAQSSEQFMAQAFELLSITNNTQRDALVASATQGQINALVRALARCYDITPTNL